MDIEKIILSHAARYPLMRATDYLKLCYQASFGGGHLIADRDSALSYLREERSQTAKSAAQPDERLLEPVGHGQYRLYLGPASRLGLRDETICQMFVASSNEKAPDPADFESDVGRLLTLSRAGAIDLPETDLIQGLERCRAGAWAPFRHSEAYRAAYAPAYRIIGARYARIVPLCAAIDRLLDEKGAARLCLDGRCASGKTTLAGLLAAIYDAQVFHMDDYFLPFEKKTTERLNTPGGNVDWERFQREVGDHLDDEVVTYQLYDCHSGRLRDKVVSARRPVQVIEGVYSLHPGLALNEDFAVFCQIDPASQKARLLRRSGPAMLERFVNEWIPLEEAYFDACGIRGRCQMTLNANHDDEEEE